MESQNSIYTIINIFWVIQNNESALKNIEKINKIF